MKLPKKKIRYITEGFLAQVGLIKPKLKESRENWESVAQEFEFEYHENTRYSETDYYIEKSKLLFSSFGFDPDQFSDKVIMDIGSGSRLKGKYFNKARLIVIEPLAERFLENLEWSDLAEADALYSVPAEELIDELKDCADFIFSINALDHCYDFGMVMQNIYEYLKPGGLAFLSFDSHYHSTLGHPLVLTDKGCQAVFQERGFIVERHSKGFGEEFRKHRDINGYDLSSTCINYWLRKPAKA
jgi:SAM-dependent methyltransferase